MILQFGLIKIQSARKKVLKSVHPSPLSAYRGFFGCGHFSAANTYLQQQGLGQINWQLPDRDSALKALQEY